METLQTIHLDGGRRIEVPTEQRPRFLGIDIGAETIKIIELCPEPGGPRVLRRELLEHGKQPGPVLVEALRGFDWHDLAGAAVTGRFAAQVNLARIPTKQAQIRGYDALCGAEPATIVSIGSHGFSVLELRPNGASVFRENSRCSQGTGNFLRQLVERFSLTVEEASRMCADVQNPAPLSGRCPVILKTDMTHLANKGEDRARILAGLFDAVCENVLVLLKPGASPRRVLLIGGVARAPRVRRVIAAALAEQGMELYDLNESDTLFLEAVGCACIAAESNRRVPALDRLLAPRRPQKLEQLPRLADSLHLVRRLPARAWAPIRPNSRLLLGLDIGSTGSKAVAIDAASREVIWESYRQTLGNPVGAAQDLLERFVAGPGAEGRLIAFGATGSGREVAGSLLTNCYGKDAVFIVNEIVAHATGALQYDPSVDTIFEIGGQDAKYIRLAEGRIVDCAMNEACSAGTGSFIEEQGRKFAGIDDVRHLGQVAMEAHQGVSLGQHCSVFMAEVIDESVAGGVDRGAIISGLYDSIIKNYLNRVKGDRSVGKVIFCQGMPFSADALAAAVARQTGSLVIVPPKPGTVGAMGIALLAARELRLEELEPVDPARFLGASVQQKDTFVCNSTSGCGGAGNHCRIERLRTIVAEHRSVFTWGGGCALYDKGTRKRKLPDHAPDPFRERAELLEKLLAPCAPSRGRPRVALSDEFMVKGLFPFFATFFHHAGLDLEIVGGADQAALKRGIQSAAVPFCAPMQLFCGLAEKMAESRPQYLFAPMVRTLPRGPGQRCSIVCPIVQASPKLVGCTLAREHSAQGRPSPATSILSPLVDFGPGGFQSELFLKSCAALGRQLGLAKQQWRSAWAAAAEVQREFDESSRRLGERALQFCQERGIVPVIVLGRNYTIYNRILNSNVPAILREQGAIGIPVDCYPLADTLPQFGDMYWGYGQHILRAAHHVRRTPGHYALYCSNYSCGPDSFNLHFVAYIMEGKPFAVIETDGHAGDAGTKTRVEAFLHCVEEHRHQTSDLSPPRSFANLQFTSFRLADRAGRQAPAEKVLVPNLGPASEAVAAVLRATGLNAESLPPPDGESLRLGRRYTSGKECLPMPLTLGSLLQRLEKAAPRERFIYFMPSTDGPCRFGVYNLLNGIVLERLGWSDRVRIWSPKDSGYFNDLPPGGEILALAGVLACDLLLQAKLDVRPLETRRGAAEALYAHWFSKLIELLDQVKPSQLGRLPALWQVASGDLFGVTGLLEQAAVEFAALRGPGNLPLVEVTGEIYVRAVDFSNDFLVRKLEERGLRVHLAPQSEWLAYCGYNKRKVQGHTLLTQVSHQVQQRLEHTALAAMAPHLGWPAPPSVTESLEAAEPFVSPNLHGEAVLTLGASLSAWRRGQIDAVVNVGPLECMPSKIAEAQFHHLTESEGLLSLTLAFNGDPLNPSALDNFAYEVKTRFQRRHSPGEVATDARTASTQPALARQQ